MSRTLNAKVRFLITVLLLAAFLAGCDGLNPYSLSVSEVSLPFGKTTVTFDDISYDARLARVIVPSAETGMLVLIDPVSGEQTPIQGFSAQTDSANPVIGTTSAAYARGFIFALDRSAKRIYAIDPGSQKFVASAPVQDAPDYIRYVSATSELWVTETAINQIEVFPVAFNNNQPPAIKKSTTISVPNGPEALYIDRLRGLAYTNQPKVGTTAVIQVMTHSVVDHWGNGCSKARGMTMDEERGYLFLVCNEGKLVVMDVRNNGLQITSLNFGGKLDFVAYNAHLKHVYLPSASSGVLGIFQLVETPIPTPTPGATQSNALNVVGGEDVLATPIPGPKVSLVPAGTADIALKSRCVTTDDHDNIWVCDPNTGQLFLIHDSVSPGS